MLRFLFGAAFASTAFLVLSKHPEWLDRALDEAREQLRVASRNIERVASHDRCGGSGCKEYDAGIDYERAESLVASMDRVSSDRLWQVMGEDDFDRRAAAGQVLLVRAGIPLSEDGIDLIKRRYVKSERPDDVRTGFSYLGLLALQDVPCDRIVHMAQGYVERNPQEEACDNALWALGELGSEEMVPYFFEIIQQERQYGAAARERAFCCLAQCGRYTAARRVEMVPGFLEVYHGAHTHQTRAWAMQALAHCAPGVHARSIEDWESWWAGQ